MSDYIGAGNTLIVGGAVSIFDVLLICYALSGVRKYVESAQNTNE